MNNLKSTIAEEWLFLASKNIVIACSGGVDSMTLASILIDLKFDIELVHINYKLRGKDSQLDQKLVEDYCGKNHLKLHLHIVDSNEQIALKEGNLQEEARKIRYAQFEKIKLQSKNNYIALGQHLDDQVETFLMHIARKSGIMGMSCMHHNKNRYIRPFLKFTKQDIIDYALSTNVKWREDESNKSNKYTRNILRNSLIPSLKKTNPNLNQDISVLITAFQQKQQVLEDKMMTLSSQIKTDGILTFSIFDKLLNEEKIELLRQLFLPSQLLIEIEKLRKSHKGKQIILDNDLFDNIYFENNFFLFKRKETSAKPLTYLLKVEDVNSLPESFKSNELFIDPTKIKGNLKLRKWEIGDRMKPLGLKGSKLISDIIKDAKVQSHLKEDVLVLTDDVQIIWCVNIRVSGDVIAQKESLKIWRVRVEQYQLEFNQ